MTKILYIRDIDNSYAASEIEQNIGIYNFAAMVESNGGEMEYESEEYNFACHAKILEFEGIDPEFSLFIKSNLLDYDYSKHTNYFIL